MIHTRDTGGNGYMQIMGQECYHKGKDLSQKNATRKAGSEPENSKTQAALLRNEVSRRKMDARAMSEMMGVWG